MGINLALGRVSIVLGNYIRRALNAAERFLRNLAPENKAIIEEEKEAADTGAENQGAIEAESAEINPDGKIIGASEIPAEAKNR